MNSIFTNIIITVLAAQPFTIHEYKDVGQDANLYVFTHSEQSPPVILVHDNTMLKIYDNWNIDKFRSFIIPEKSLAFDTVDIDGDLLLDCIFLSNQKIDIHFSGRDTPAHQVIELEEPVDWISHNPVPTTLLKKIEGNWFFSIHHTDSIHLYSMEGERINTITPPSPASNALTITPVIPHQLDSPTGVEFRVDTAWSQSYDFPGVQNDIAQQGSYQFLTERMLQEAESKEPDKWPWFPLQPSGDNKIRILAAKAAPDYNNTYIRIQRPETRNLPAEHGQYNFSPNRLFPGNLLLLPTGLPDVNMDGYSDLIFWRIPLPGTSISNLLHGAQSGKWSIRYTIHLYDPSMGNFHPAPSSRIKISVPLAWIFLNPISEPVRNLMFSDMDSDGDADFICSTDDRTISAWLYNNGYNKNPDYTVKFKKPMEWIHWDSKEDHYTASMLVRSDTSLYLLTIDR